MRRVTTASPISVTLTITPDMVPAVLLGELAATPPDVLSRMLVGAWLAQRPPTTLPRVPVTSAVIGQQGEALIREILAAEYHVEATGVAHAGDLFVSRPRRYGEGKLRMMVEVKNYAGKVPAAQVEKFLRDLQVRTDVHGGLMVSLQSDITGKHAMQVDLGISRSISRSGGNVPAVYLRSRDPDMIRAAMGLLYAHLDHHWAIEEQYEGLSRHAYPRLYRWAGKASESLTQLTEGRTQLLHLRQTMTTQIEQIHQTLFAFELRIHNSLEKIRTEIGRALPPAELNPESVELGETREVMLTALHEYLCRTYPRSVYATRADHRHSLQRLILAACLANAATMWVLHPEKRKALLACGGRARMYLQPELQKTVWGRRPDPGPVTLQQHESYYDGWIVQSLDRYGIPIQPVISHAAEDGHLLKRVVHRDQPMPEDALPDIDGLSE
jgi:hypothetical protein